ncbi:hypothetical protein BKA70DRAFT_1236963 [Coprinopsis sp. MPI-PUGE-AT-0042]|nr:hypothetical protein BKA70DRAFT_1236963 [Coprinopsis sp. MPI-PUGE-AT-0042]
MAPKRAASGMVQCPNLCGEEFRSRGIEAHLLSCRGNPEDEAGPSLAQDVDPRRRKANHASRALKAQLGLASQGLSSRPRSKGLPPIHIPSVEVTTQLPVLPDASFPPNPITTNPPSPDIFQNEFNQFESSPSHMNPYPEAPEAFNLDHAVEDLGRQPMEDDIMPWSPFRHRCDFELAEFMRATNLNLKQIERLLSIVGKIAGGAEYSLVDACHVTETWDSGAKDFNTRMDKKTITVPYQEEECKFDVWSFDLWEWALQLLHDPLYASQMRWDSLRLFRHNGFTFERFINEPWTADQWWNIQDQLPEDGVPFSIILYADKTKLSSIGTAKGYPVYARDGNLPIDIRNSNGFAGGRMVALLPIVQDEADKAGKPAFVNFKSLVWHESFKTFLKKVTVFSKTGCKVHCGDNVTRNIFPLVLILSSDFEEHNFPCPVCLVPAGEQCHVSKTYPLRTTEDHEAIYAAVRTMSAEAREATLKDLGLRYVSNIFWALGHTDIYRALCWDRLHAYHGGLFSDHILKKILDLLDDSNASKRSLRMLVESQLALFPRWRDLNHFTDLSKIKEFSDGRRYEDLSKVLIYVAHNALDESRIGSRRGYWLLCLTRAYLELDMYSSLRNHTETTLRQGRQALLKWEEILKGVTRNGNTKPNEKLHHVLKDYYSVTNFKDVNEQFAKFQSWDLTMAIISENIERHNASLAHLVPEEDEDAQGEVGSPIPGPEVIRVESVAKHVPKGLQAALALTLLLKKIQVCLAQSSDDAHRSFKVTANTAIKVYRYAKVNYASLEDASVATDFLRMNPDFHDRERYDACLIDVGGGQQVCAQMVTIIGLMVAGKEVLLAVLIPYDEKLTEATGSKTRAKIRRDEAFGFIRIRERSRSKPAVVFADSIIRGALLVQDFSETNVKDFLVVDVVDADMWLRMKRDRHLLATNVLI